MSTWDGDEYQERFDKLAASGMDMHGEVAFVMRYTPNSVLDAGCGTGRVAIELVKRGVPRVVGADVDESMLATARKLSPEIDWVTSDLCELDLGRRFDVVVMAGNVPLFTPPGTQPALVAGVAKHVAPGNGVLVSGFSLGRGYEVADFDADCEAVGLTLAERFSTWSGQPFTDTSDYAVSVHRS